ASAPSSNTISTRRCRAVPAADETAFKSTGASTRTPRGTYTNAPQAQPASLAATKTSSAGTIVPRYGSTSSGCSAAATPSASTITPSAPTEPASELPSTCVSDTPSPSSNSSSGTDSSASAGAAPNRDKSNEPRSV